MFTKKEITKIANNETPPGHVCVDSLAEALLDAWAALATIEEMSKMRSDVNGFKAVAKNHLPDDYNEK